jgi:hypothetical protein
MQGTAPLILGALGAGLAVLALRASWARKTRSAAANAAGWSLMALAAVLAGFGAGAWGVAVASLAGMGVAAVLLGIAAVTSPAGRAAASNRRVGMLPEAGEPRRIGRRVGTFLMVVVGGLLASLAWALGVRGFGGLAGWDEADSNALALFAVPLAWSVIATTVLMQQRRRSQFATLAIASLPALPVLLSGALR